ncbi:suppressor of lurcher protein 1-like [Battus philenor]|uniref:suppressor of lurcher protein 1-like n=1 Tax=Battus philenor TaxID=42288 RepID=UPI0035D0C0E7
MCVASGPEICTQKAIERTTLGVSLRDRMKEIMISAEEPNAFNSVDFDVLLAILRSLNVSPLALAWFESYLRGRSQRIHSDDVSSDWCDLGAGVPQGGVLSPLLFSVFINTVTSKSTTLILLIHISLHTVDEGQAVDPSCQCIRFTSTYGKERGTFSSPDYPRPYSIHATCFIYTFIASSHQIVELLFTDFDIYKEHLDCTRGDFVKVYSEVDVHGPGPPGINEYSIWSRSLCGSRADAPPALYSHGPVLILELNMGGKKSNATGFIGTFKFIDRRNFETNGVHVQNTWCDYIFDSHPSKPSYGRLYSPRYPSSYPTNVRCNYHFNARKNERIKLLFEESFLQKGDDSCLNRADVIKVYDGRSTTAPVLAILCNEVVGYEILSTGAEILVQFTANSNSPGQGFKARYQFQMEDNTDTDANTLKIKAEEAISALGPAVSATTSSCHQIFRSDKSKKGIFTSPKYPSPYPQKTQCHYDFVGRGRERIRLVFEDFSLPKIAGHTVDCDSTDSIDIFLYVDGRLEKMASFCGTDLPKPIMSNGPKLSVIFRGIHGSRSSKGFKISYNFITDYAIKTGKQLLEFPCAFVFNSTNRERGVVTSPNYPGVYPRDTECNYFFYGSRDERVRLHFTHFDIEGVIPCKAVSASDYIQLSNQMIDSSSTRYCGQLKDLHFTSEKNFLRVTFKSNDRLDATGFKANYIFLKDSEMHSMIMPDVNRGSLSTYLMDMWLLTIVVNIIKIIKQCSVWY